MATAVGPPPPTDSQPPSPPGTLTATGGQSTVTLGWGAASDNVGVTRYNVHRSTTAGFTPSAANRIAQPTGTGYTDSGLVPGTYYYRVTAEDAAGNIGAASNQATGTVTGDVTPPGPPGTLQATGTIGSANLSWGAASDNVAVVRYNVHRSTVAGFVPGSSNRIAQPTGTTYTDVVAPGTYFYRVTRRGRRRQPRRSVERGGGHGDERHNGADGGGDRARGGLDRLGHGRGHGKRIRQRRRHERPVHARRCRARSSRHERPLQHVLGDHDGDAGTAPPPRRRGRRCGNQTTSAAVTVTVDNSVPPPPAGLVAAWSFNAGAGTTAADATGKGHTGTISGAAWSAAGKNGGALSFDGIDDWVTVADANDLDLTNGMTLSAWVRPSGAGADWQTVMLKESPGFMVYALYADTDTNRPSGHVVVGGDLDVRGTAQPRREHVDSSRRHLRRHQPPPLR
jgi:fibronectin type 3 domain-containing protein